MFNYRRIPILNIIEIIFIKLINKNYYYKYNKNTIHLFFNESKLLNFKNVYIVDNSNLITQKLKNNIIFFIVANKQFENITIYCYNQKCVYSNIWSTPSTEWYERELVEKTTILIRNIFDTRNLLYSYNLKNINNSLIHKNKYYWIRTNVIKKNITSGNNIRIIL